MKVNYELILKGLELGKAIKSKNAVNYARTKIHKVLEPYATMNDKIECLLEFAVSCNKELPMEIIGGENKENDIRFFMVGVVNGLVEK